MRGSREGLGWVTWRVSGLQSYVFRSLCQVGVNRLVRWMELDGNHLIA